MATISIRELHQKTGHWVRRVAKVGEVYVTDRGQTVAKLLPQVSSNEVPFFRRRKPSAGFQKLQKAGKLKGGADSTRMISEDREDREV